MERTIAILNRTRYLPRLILLAIVVCGCAVEVDQPVELTLAPPVDNSPTLSPSPLLPATQIPVTWAHLGLTGKLVYISSMMEEDRLSNTVQMLDLATGTLTTLFTAHHSWIYYATVTPDGRMLAMSHSPAGEPGVPSSRGLYILALEAAAELEPLVLPPTADDHYIQVEWSPDGKYIYYVHYDHRESEGQFYENYEIFRMAYPDGIAEKILDHAFWPRLSYDSTRLVYIALDPASGKHDLFVSNADGTDPQRVSFAGPWIPEVMDAPIFTPDGKSILFSAPAPAQASQPNRIEQFMGIQIVQAHNVPSDWWSVPVTGGTPTRLTNLQTINLFASISPDQQHIASLRGEGLFVMDASGLNLTRLVSDPEVHATVSWIP